MHILPHPKLVGQLINWNGGGGGGGEECFSLLEGRKLESIYPFLNNVHKRFTVYTEVSTKSQGDFLDNKTETQFC